MTAWADKNDGILALDLNGNGKIDDGREIFGNNTFLPDGTLAPHGYAALSQYDSNHDGKIDGHDEIWEKLRVWRDKNEDAKTGKNELHTLDELGIAAINLNAEEVSETDEAGNRVTHRATVTKTDGTTMASADVWFNVNTAQTRYLGDETVSEDIAALPNVRGFGNVPSLHVAMNKDSKLKEMVETYLSTDSEHRDALLPEIIYKWTGSENIVSNSRGRHIDARTLAALERLTGDTFLQNGRDPNPNTNAARILQDEFDKFSRYTEAKILLQKPEYANARSIMDFLIDRADANDEPVNWDLFAQYLSQVNKAGQTEKVKTEYRLIEDFLTYSSKYKDSLRDFFTQHAEDYSEFFLSGIIKSLTGDETNNTLTGSNRPDAILGLAGNDTLEGKAGNDYLNGGAGDDKLTGGAGHRRDRHAAHAGLPAGHPAGHHARAVHLQRQEGGHGGQRAGRHLRREGFARRLLPASAGHHPAGCGQLHLARHRQGPAATAGQGRASGGHGRGGKRRQPPGRAGAVPHQSHRSRPRGSDRPADRPRERVGARHPGAGAPAQEQPAAGGRGWRWQDRHCRGAGLAHRPGRCARARPRPPGGWRDRPQASPAAPAPHDGRRRGRWWSGTGSGDRIRPPHLARS